MKKSSRSVKTEIPTYPERPTSFSTLWVYVGLLWALGVLVIFLNRYPIAWDSLNTILSALTDFGFFHAYMAKVIGGFSVGLIFLLVATRAGALIIQQRLSGPVFSKHELWVLGAALGLGLFSFCVLGLGAGHLWYRQIFIALLVGVGVWSLSTPSKVTAAPSFHPTSWTGVWKFFLAVLALLYLLGAAAPEIFYDSLHYHLAIPNLYRMDHRITAVPTTLYADFVMTIQMLYGFVLTLGNTLSAKILHVGMSGLLGFGFVLFARRFFGTASGWLAALFFFAIPMVFLNAMTAGTDVGGAFLFFASAVALVWALERRTRELFHLAGALTGIAASTKFPAFAFIPVACVIIAWQLGWTEKRPWREWLGLIFHFGFMAMLFLAPILLKNSVLHGNPLYPFGGIFWGHPQVDPMEWRKFMGDTSARNLHGVFSSLSAFVQFILEPWFVSMGTQGTVGPLLLMGLPFILKPSPRSLAYKTFQRYALLLWGVWLLTSTVPRYGLPAMVLVCPLIAEAVLSVTANTGLRWGLLGTFGIGIFANLAVQLMFLFNWEGWQVVAGKLSEQDYLGHTHTTYPTPPYDALVWMNDHLSPDAVVLFAGESRSYYLERRSIPSSIPGPQPVVLWSHQCKSSAELAQKMRSEGVTHIFLNFVEALRTDSYQVFRWDPASWVIFDDFWAHHTRLIWREEDSNRSDPHALYVFEVLSDSAAAQAHPLSPNPFARWKPAGAP